MPNVPSVNVNNPHHAYDPVTQPELFQGVLLRRVAAFFMDQVYIFLLSLPVYLLVIFVGILTLGAGWLLIPFVWLITSFLYFGMTVTERNPATWGMRQFGIEMRTWTGLPAYSLLAIFHYTLFWAITGGAIATIFVIIFVWLVPFFDSRRRAIHDMITGVIFVNNQERARQFTLR